tara:strand:- start:15 stop:257 length:243 start_codon:yes stop_codon:yes gene_type:complete
MEAYISLIFYCLLVAIVLYILWQCVFQPFRRYQEQQIRRFTELHQDDEEEIDLELGEHTTNENASLTSVDLDSDEIEEKI